MKYLVIDSTDHVVRAFSTYNEARVFCINKPTWRIKSVS